MPFDFDRNYKETPQFAEELLTRLGMAIAEGNIRNEDAQTKMEEQLPIHIELSNSRLAKARRAYQKAKNALTEDQVGFAIDHARRGIMHIELAEKHFLSNFSDLAQITPPAPKFEEGSSEDAILALAEAICRIKMVAEYKNITLTHSLKDRLLDVVQLLQDAIEEYGQSESAANSKAAESGLIWAQFIYGNLTGDELFAKKNLSKSMRALTQFAWQSTSGIAASFAALKNSKEARAHLQAIEKELEAALLAYKDNELNELEKFLRLGLIESQSLTKYLRRDQSEKSTSFNLSLPEPNSLNQRLARMATLLNRHHKQPEQASAAIEKLRTHLSQLKKVVKSEEWEQVGILLDKCQLYYLTLKTEIAKLDI